MTNCSVPSSSATASTSPPRSSASSSPLPGLAFRVAVTTMRDMGRLSRDGRPARRAQQAALPLVAVLEAVVHPRARPLVLGGHLGGQELEDPLRLGDAL